MREPRNHACQAPSPVCTLRKSTTDLSSSRRSVGGPRAGAGAGAGPGCCCCGCSGAAAASAASAARTSQAGGSKIS
eukprot:12734841-Alexandrium_andersonii.AAC.1